MPPRKRNKTENVNPNIRESTSEEAKVDNSTVIPSGNKNETDNLVKLSPSKTFSIRLGKFASEGNRRQSPRLGNPEVCPEGNPPCNFSPPAGLSPPDNFPQNPKSKTQNGITPDETQDTPSDTTSADSIKDKVENSKSIDPSLNLLVQQIEKQNSNLSVVVARRFCYKIAQTLMEVMISEPRKFNVLEEFILRASLEFTPPPTSQELASVLGLDTIFVQSTAENLVRFKSAKFSQTGEIKITPEGREFYQQGNVSLPPQGKQIYAIADPFAENLTFQFEALPLGSVDFPDFAELVTIENHLPSLQSLTITDIQQLIRNAGLGLHVPEEGKIVTNFQTIGKPQICWRSLSIFVLLDTIENKYIIQVRRDKRILEKASNWLTELQAQQQFDLNKLGVTLSQEKIPVSQSTAKPKRQRATTKKSQK